MKCFNGEYTNNYFRRMTQSLKTEISQLSDGDIDNTDESAWVDYFYAKYEIEPLCIYEDSRSIAFKETKVKSYNTFAFNLPEGKKYIEVPGVHVTCIVPFTGNVHLLQLTPSTHTLFEPFDVMRMTEPKDGQVGQLVFAEDFKQSDVTAEQINRHFDERLKDFKKESDRCNEDTTRYNEQLESVVYEELHKRIGQLDKLANLRQDLQIPLNRIKGAPYAKPIPLQKRKVQFRKPKPSKDVEIAYSISDSDYAYITDIIDNCCATMETTPASYKGLGEEQLRDHILSLLNSHFENTTGETFRNNGKTDIHIPRDDHSAYIAECKIWHGPKAFLRAIEQLFSYTTWRDTKVSVVVFNKGNKKYDDVLSAIDASLYERAENVKRVKHARWICRAIDEESQRVMHLTVQVFNLFS